VVVDVGRRHLSGGGQGAVFGDAAELGGAAGRGRVDGAGDGDGDVLRGGRALIVGDGDGEGFAEAVVGRQALRVGHGVEPGAGRRIHREAAVGASGVARVSEDGVVVDVGRRHLSGGGQGAVFGDAA